MWIEKKKKDKGWNGWEKTWVIQRLVMQLSLLSPLNVNCPNSFL